MFNLFSKKKFHVPLILGIVSNISASRPILIRSLTDLFSRYQSFHQTNLQFLVAILGIHYVVFLSNVGIGFL